MWLKPPLPGSVLAVTLPLVALPLVALLSVTLPSVALLSVALPLGALPSSGLPSGALLLLALSSVAHADGIHSLCPTLLTSLPCLMFLLQNKQCFPPSSIMIFEHPGKSCISDDGASASPSVQGSCLSMFLEHFTNFPGIHNLTPWKGSSWVTVCCFSSLS